MLFFLCTYLNIFTNPIGKIQLLGFTKNEETEGKNLECENLRRWGNEIQIIGRGSRFKLEEEHIFYPNRKKIRMDTVVLSTTVSVPPWFPN